MNLIKAMFKIANKPKLSIEILIKISKWASSTECIFSHIAKLRTLAWQLLGFTRIYTLSPRMYLSIVFSSYQQVIENNLSKCVRYILIYYSTPFTLFYAIQLFSLVEQTYILDMILWLDFKTIFMLPEYINIQLKSVNQIDFFYSLKFLCCQVV